MDEIKKYLLCVISAGIVCAVVIKIAGDKGLLSSMIKLLAGLFMSITVISPVISLQINEFSNYLEGMEIDAQGLVAEGLNVASAEKSALIIENTEAYILDKASSLGAHLEAEITLSNSEELNPYSVCLIGDASPYVKQKMQRIITEDLGIPEERQSWK